MTDYIVSSSCQKHLLAKRSVYGDRCPDCTYRPTGVKVYPLPDEANGPHVYGTYALIMRDTADGVEVKVVHTEGVAYTVTDEKPWRWTDYADVQTYSPAELVVLTTNVEPVDLSVWVRSFGARLESNFGQIYRWATSQS